MARAETSALQRPRPQAAPSRLARLVRGLAAALFVLALPVLVVTTVIRVMVSDVGFYERGLRAHDAEVRTGIDLGELDRAAGEIVRYFERGSGALEIQVVVDGEQQPLFNEREVAHMRDVRSLVRLLFLVQEVSLVYVMAYVAGAVLWTGERSLRALAWLALGGMALGLGVAAAVGLAALGGFEALWTRFHEVAFRNDLWRLNPASDRLIQMFPEPFWEEAVLIVALASLAATAGVILLAGGYLGWSARAGGGSAGNGAGEAGREAPG